METRVYLCSYLLFGCPGKSTLLKAISARLKVKDGEQVKGKISYNGRQLKVRSVVFVR